MGNIVFNKPATASNYVAPYTPGRAVDGSLVNVQRWLSNTVPCWLMVDLQGSYWVDRWVVRHLPVAGWAANYVLNSYKLQGSLDNANWFDLDVVTNNTISVTDRNFMAVEVQYLRMYVSTGLNINPKMASITELEVYEAAPTSQFLTNLTVSAGTLEPAFARNQYTYSVNVGNAVEQITVTPTAEDPQATIRVNGDVVPSGQPSAPQLLNVGDNTITVQVTSKVGGLVQNYTITVNRASSAYLSGLVLKANGTKAAAITPTFARDVYAYSAVIANLYDKVTITPTAEDSEATIKVAGTVVQSGQPSALIPVAVGQNPINIEVTPKVGVDPKTYVLTVERRAT